MATSDTTVPLATRGRWLIAGAGVLLQLALGGVYAWSVFSKALQDPDSAFALTKAEAALPFSVTIGMIFLGTFIGGRVQDVKGPRIVALTGGVVYSLGVMLAGLSGGRDQYWLLILGYGVIAGFGLGLGYIVPGRHAPEVVPRQARAHHRHRRRRLRLRRRAHLAGGPATGRPLPRGAHPGVPLARRGVPGHGADRRVVLPQPAGRLPGAGLAAEDDRAGGQLRARLHAGRGAAHPAVVPARPRS